MVKEALVAKETYMVVAEGPERALLFISINTSPVWLGCKLLKCSSTIVLLHLVFSKGGRLFWMQCISFLHKIFRNRKSMCCMDLVVLGRHRLH